MRKHLVIAAFAIAAALAGQNQAKAQTSTPALASQEATHEFSARRGHRHSHRHRITRHGAFEGDPRPAAWCMWWLRRHLGIPKSAFPRGEFNVAAAARHIGEAVSGPGEGVIAVWRHHVGLIRGGCDGRGCVVLSGNDSGRVRERYRSLRNVVAYRRWHGGQMTEARGE